MRHGFSHAEAFYTDVWQLDVAHRKEGALYLRGTGSDHHLLALYAGGPVPQIRQVTLRARSAEALQAVADAVPRSGGRILSPIAPLDRNPAGGTGLTFCDPHGRIFQVVHGDARRAEAEFHHHQFRIHRRLRTGHHTRGVPAPGDVALMHETRLIERR